MVKFSFDTERHPPATCMMPLRTTVKLVFTMWLHCRLRYFPALHLFLATSRSKLDVTRFSVRHSVHASYGVYSCVQHFRRNFKLRLTNTNPPFWAKSNLFGFCRKFHEHPPTYIVDSVTTRNGCRSPLVIAGLSEQTATQFIFLYIALFCCRYSSNNK